MLVMRHLTYPGTLKTVAFRRCLRAFQRVLDGNHRLGWWIANDMYERLRDARMDKSGVELNQGEQFNETRKHWETLIANDYPDVTLRFIKAFELVTKAVYMLKHGNLEFQYRKPEEIAS